jgi:hypothetical protein
LMLKYGYEGIEESSKTHGFVRRTNPSGGFSAMQRRVGGRSIAEKPGGRRSRVSESNRRPLPNRRASGH